MKSRTIALVAAVAAVTVAAGCGSSEDTAAPSVVTVTTVVTASPSTVASTDVADTTEPATTEADETADQGPGASAYVGHYQRHSSTLDLATDQTGTILQGDGAVDGETWAVTWQPAAQGIDITYQRLITKSGRGLFHHPSAGLTLTAAFATGETGNEVLSVSPISPQSSGAIWCLPGKPSPECGA